MGAGRLESFQHCRTLEDKSLGTKIFLKKKGGRRAVTSPQGGPAPQAGDRLARVVFFGCFFIIFFSFFIFNFFLVLSLFGFSSLFWLLLLSVF